MRFSASFTALAAFASTASALTLPLNRHSANNSTIVARQDAGPKQVFAHFMLGIVASYTVADWEQDINQAKNIGIDGFALNSGTDTYTRDQLHNAYQAAKNVGGFKLFISFDFTSFSKDDVNGVAGYIKEFAGEEAQLKIGDKVFVSTFYGDNFPFRAAEAAAGVPLFACPAWGPEALASADADCGFQWNSWPSENNLPVDKPMTLDGDKWWETNLAGKPYMAGASPWFFTHFGTDTWNKNWIFKSDTLWTDRWQQLLELAPQFIEIITWNDYGESHYIGPLRDEKPDVYAGGPTGAVKWTPGHDHSAWATVAAPYIAAYKQGASSPIVSSDHLVYYYRQQSNSLQCSDPVPTPTGASLMADSVFVTALLTEPGSIIITSGGNAPVSIDVDAGVHTVSAPMGVGKQSFQLVRGGNAILSGDGYRDIRDSCDVYDFNPFVGEVSGGGGQSAPGPVAPAPETPAPAPETPTETAAPAPETPAPTPEPQSAPGPVAAPPADSPAPASSKSVSFSTEHETVWGDNIYISGSVDALGNWDAGRAVMLNTDATTYPTWNANVDLPAGTAYDYKYILKTSDGQVTWEGETQHATA
ncbi:glycosyl hydrolase family 71-domain-containing protein [Auriculariales sp. MPI-PUGE-AT-0066]|nr:glycosyl hydrolase family 71-domain-containing protein [Auriculariales sp. MPI-PUGE-AT-0066]